VSSAAERCAARQNRGAQQRVARLGRKGPDACSDERVEALGDGNTVRDLVLAAAVELARDLDRIKRVAAGRLRDPHERRSRKRAPELVREHAVESGDGKRAELEVLDLEVALERRDWRLVELGRAHREEAPHGSLADPPQGELDHRRRRSVKPVEVIDRAYDLRFAGELA
jgi:hypothetical protein